MRAKRPKRREIDPDPIYKSNKVAKLINRSMNDGKKSVAQNHVYSAFEIVEKKFKTKPLEVFEQALENITPRMEVRSRRVGGAAYQVPVPVKDRRGFALAIRWLVLEANKRPNSQYHSFADKLAAEIMDAANNKGGAVERKLNAHKMAEANKAFSHFRW